MTGAGLEHGCQKPGPRVNQLKLNTLYIQAPSYYYCCYLLLLLLSSLLLLRICQW